MEQTGTATDCNGSNPTYFAWYDFYPVTMEVISSPISPGDVINAQVSYNPNTGSAILTLTDNTRGWTRSASGYGSLAVQADWVVERPGGTQYPLTNFGSVTFTSCTMIYLHNGRYIQGPITDNDAINQVSMTSGNTTLATASNLSSDGTSFSVTWQNSG